MSRNLLVSIVTVCLLSGLIGSWEFYLRSVYPSPYVSDPELEYRLRTESPEGSGSVRFRDRDYSFHKPPGLLRIIALGESTTWGSGLLSGEDAWPYRMETRLKRTGRPVEVINAGVNGWSCEHLRVAAKRWLPLLRPDLVVVMTGWNWPAIEEPLSWTPLPRLPFKGALAGMLKNMRLLADLHFRLERWFPRRQGLSMEDYSRLRHEHSTRLSSCVENFGIELAGYPAVIVKPPALYDTAGSVPDTPALQALTGMFTMCPGSSFREKAACHRLERDSMREGLAAVESSGHWRVVDGLQFAPADWESRGKLFLDHMHMNAEGNEELAALLDREIQPMMSSEGR